MRIIAKRYKIQSINAISACQLMRVVFSFEKRILGPGEIAQWFRALVFAEDPGSLP